MREKKYPNRLWEVRDAVNVQRYNEDKPPITQAILAKACGVTRQTIIAIEKHEQMPSYPLALRIAAALSSLPYWSDDMHLLKAPLNKP